ncbi:cytochrome P450 [Podospora fimiseda]|uniref:Cytochrome P450 n=1 Tax=Podospora fimiseda TaxID=252190 RepID=A0AAN7BF66_9PEZI|nr:cytochrome P450 [Podospora fimiseda]
MASVTRLTNDTWSHIQHGLERDSLPKIITTAVLTPLATLLLWFTISWYLNPLRKYPGPFLAGFTNLWRFTHCFIFAHDYADTIKKLHDKYDLDYPELLKTIYTTDGKWLKTEMYDNNSTIMNGQQVWTIFSTRDQVYHARIKRPVVKYFTLGSVLAIEPHMNIEIADFIKHIDTRFALNNKKFNLVDWINYFAWDQASSLTFSKRYGYMDAGHDFDSTLLIAEKTFHYFQAVSQIPWLDSFLDKNPIVRIGPPNLQNAFRITAEAYAARIAGKDQNYDPSQPDYMQQFIESKQTHPELVDDKIIMTYLIVNILAAADTTGITLQAIFYYLMRHPNAQKRCFKTNSIGFVNLKLQKERGKEQNSSRSLQPLEGRELWPLAPGGSSEIQLATAGLRKPGHGQCAP